MADLVERLRAALADRYTIERELGHGGIATVYLARDARHDRYVALKVLDPELAASVGEKRFLREIQIAPEHRPPRPPPHNPASLPRACRDYPTPYVRAATRFEKPQHA